MRRLNKILFASCGRLFLFVLPTLLFAVLLLIPVKTHAAENVPSKYKSVSADGSANPLDNEFYCEFRSSAHIFCWRSAKTDLNSTDAKEGEKSYWFDPQLSANAGHDVFRPDDDAKTSEYGWLHFPNSASGDYSLAVVSTLPIADSKNITADQGLADNDVSRQSDHATPPDSSNICNIEMFAKGDKPISCDVGDDPIKSVSNITYKSGFDSYVEVKKCDKGGLGFILCPIQEGLVDVVEQLNQWLGKLLDINSSGFQNEDLRNASQQILNIANAIYALIFLVIIFANGLSLGIDNYTLKKVVPRLVAAIVLSQFAFWITGAFIEFGNVLGRAVSQFFLGLASSAAGGASGGTGGIATGLVGALAVVGAVLLIIFFLIIVIVAILVVLAVLALRWAVLYVLILVAPLAFAANVLPNTEKLWKLWSSNLVKLVMMYPIIMAIVSGSTFLGTVMTSDSNPTVIQIIGAFLPFMGFLLAPKALKWSGSIMAATGGKVASWSAGKTKGAVKDGWSKEGGVKDQIEKRGIPTTLGSNKDLFSTQKRMERKGRAKARLKGAEEGWTKGLDMDDLIPMANMKGDVGKNARKALRKLHSEELEKQLTKAARGEDFSVSKLNTMAQAVNGFGDVDSHGDSVELYELGSSNPDNAGVSPASPSYKKGYRERLEAVQLNATARGRGAAGPPAGPPAPPAGPAAGPPVPPAPPAGPPRPPAGPPAPPAGPPHGPGPIPPAGP